MRVILYRKSDGEILDCLAWNPHHDPDHIRSEIAELAHEQHALGIGVLEIDDDIRVKSHKVELTDDAHSLRIIPKPHPGAEGRRWFLDLAKEHYRARYRSGRQAMGGMLSLSEVAEEMRTATSWRILRRGGDDTRSPEQIVRDEFSLCQASCPPPVVSVVVAVWNMEQHLERTMESILAQEVDGGLELILVDNGSIDRSRDIMAHIATEESRVSVIRLEHNLGQAVARNIGIRAARGSFISPFDADDVMLPTMLQRMLSLFSSLDTPHSALRAPNSEPSFRALSDLGGASSSSTPNSELPTPHSIDAVHCHLERYTSDLHVSLGRAAWLERDIDGQIVRHRCACLPSQLLIRRTAFTEKGAWYSEWCRWCEDVEWLLHAYFRCRLRFQRLPEVLLHRRTHSGEDSYGRKVTHHHVAWQTGLRVAYGGGRQ